MSSLWNIVHTVHETLFEHCLWSAHGFYVDCRKYSHGLHGLHTECSWSAHEVHGNMWGSVKYSIHICSCNPNLRLPHNDPVCNVHNIVMNIYSFLLFLLSIT